MKFVFLHVTTASESWAEEATQLYIQKIKHFIDFEFVSLKPTKSARSQSHPKKEEESLRILAYLQPGDALVLFDEKGKTLTSEKFAQEVERLRDSGKKRVIFLIGGAFGVSDDVRSKAQLQINLAPFVLNHLVAQVVALEQIYRSFTILKGLPYHNN